MTSNDEKGEGGGEEMKMKREDKHNMNKRKVTMMKRAGRYQMDNKKFQRRPPLGAEG